MVEFQDQLESGNVSVLVYNEQTVTPIHTTNMKAIAAENTYTIVGVTETIQPPNVSFRDLDVLRGTCRCTTRSMRRHWGSNLT